MNAHDFREAATKAAKTFTGGCKARRSRASSGGRGCSEKLTNDSFGGATSALLPTDHAAAAPRHRQLRRRPRALGQMLPGGRVAVIAAREAEVSLSFVAGWLQSLLARCWCCLLLVCWLLLYVMFWF